jgi:hypothetical protein
VGSLEKGLEEGNRQVMTQANRDYLDALAIRRHAAATVSRWWFGYRMGRLMDVARTRRRIIRVIHKRKVIVMIPLRNGRSTR